MCACLCPILFSIPIFPTPVPIHTEVYISVSLLHGGQQKGFGESVSRQAGTNVWLGDWDLHVICILLSCTFYYYYYYYFVVALCVCVPTVNGRQFEYQQAQLELEIENLSWKVERAEITDVAVSRLFVCGVWPLISIFTLHVFTVTVFYYIHVHNGTFSREKRFVDLPGPQKNVSAELCN